MRTRVSYPPAAPRTDSEPVVQQLLRLPGLEIPSGGVSASILLSKENIFRDERERRVVHDYGRKNGAPNDFPCQWSLFMEPETGKPFGAPTKGEN